MKNPPFYPLSTNLSTGIHPYPLSICTMWASSILEYVGTWWNRDVHLRHTLHLQPSNPPAHPPTLYLCLELEWLVFHFGLPGALVRSLAWPVYHYWSLSLTWTNRGLFSKVVSQVAVTDMSGTTQLDLGAQREREKIEKKNPAWTRARLDHTHKTDFFDKCNLLF